MDDIFKLRPIYKLKSVYRIIAVEKRKESSAEHCWSALMLADYFLSKIKRKLNRMRVYELLMYHDLVEIYAGDVALFNKKERINKKHNEEKALERLKKELPKETSEKLVSLYEEYVQRKTIESKFVKAIDRLDPLFNQLDYKKEWKIATEKQMRDLHKTCFKDFPELQNTFDEIIDYAKKNGYFDLRKMK